MQAPTQPINSLVCERLLKLLDQQKCNWAAAPKSECRSQIKVDGISAEYVSRYIQWNFNFCAATQDYYEMLFAKLLFPAIFDHHAEFYFRRIESLYFFQIATAGKKGSLHRPTACFTQAAIDEHARLMLASFDEAHPGLGAWPSRDAPPPKHGTPNMPAKEAGVGDWYEYMDQNYPPLRGLKKLHNALCKLRFVLGTKLSPRTCSVCARASARVHCEP